MAVKLKGWHIALIIILLFAVYSGYIQINWPSTQPEPAPGQTAPQPGEVSVTKQLKISVIDMYAGSTVSSGTLIIYDSDGKTQLESLNLGSANPATTSLSYKSGKTIWLYYYSGNSKIKKQITVPYMSAADAESLTTNPVEFKVFSICTLTDTLQDGFGNSYSDGANWNKTSGGNPGASVVSATYSWYVSSDNTGYVSSHDPIYGVDWKPVLYVKVFGTNYANVILTGFDGAFEKGTAMYYYKVLDDTELTKYKVGNEYVYDGAGSFTFTVDLSGYSGDAADLQIYLYVYSDPEYFKTYGSFGPDAVELAEQTLNLVD